MSETFRKSRGGWIRSSAGYGARVLMRTGIEFEDEFGISRIDSEVMSAPRHEVLIYVGSIPDAPDRPRELVVSRLTRLLDAEKRSYILETAWFD